MSVDKDFVLTALLQHNFFPLQSPDLEELPPIFSSKNFSVEAAKRLSASSGHRAKGYDGYDAVEYRLTRFNGVSRCCSIPHPTAYAELALRIYEDWDKLSIIADNERSIIRPRHHSDGRIIIMDDYGTASTKMSRNLADSFGRRFFVRTDISNCFPSVYSHAIPWALVGMPTAKKNRSKKEWFNQLDEKTRQLKRNETQGVAIGPATSNIVFEVILSQVDKALEKEFEARDKGLVFRRFIDDYTAYCETEDQAQRFIRSLAEKLAFYKLALNIAKTVVIPLPQSLDSDWLTELSLALPKGKSLPVRDAVAYLDLAVRLASQRPGGSVLKYALKSLCGQKLTPAAVQAVLEYALTLSFYQPVLLPVLEPLFDATTHPGEFAYSEELRRIVRDNASARRSDGVAWGLYYLMKYSVAIRNKTVEALLAEPDCIALLLLYVQGDKSLKTRVVEYAESLDHSDLYGLDQYWLLLYELFRDGAISNPYAGEGAFEILKDEGVSFVLQKGAGS